MAEKIEVPKDRLIQAMQTHCVYRRSDIRNGENPKSLGSAAVLSALMGITITRLYEMTSAVFREVPALRSSGDGQALYEMWYGSTHTE